MLRVYALIRDGAVDNVIVAEAWEGGVDVTETSPQPAIGWRYDGVSFFPTPPAQEE